MVIITLLIVVGGGTIALRGWYNHNLSPASTIASQKYFSVERGKTVHEIGIDLKTAGLIRSSGAFEYYVRTNALFNDLQAGTYVLSPTMSVPNIVKKIQKGEVARNLLTILPGKRLDQIKEAFVQAGYTPGEVNSAFDISQYSSHPLLAGLPAAATLEGFLYPDSFQKDSNTSAQVIIRESLDEMQRHLSLDVLTGFAAQNLNLYQAITLASIVLQETYDPAYQPTVAQVFLLRMKQNTRLESNVTANFAADSLGRPRDVRIDSSYNTYLHAGLPPGPIGNVTASAIKAVAHPDTTDYLFFVAGDDEKIHFSHTKAEHDDSVAKYCTKKCAQ